MGECLPKIWDLSQKFGFGDCHNTHFLYVPAILLQYYYCSLSFKSSSICYKTAHSTKAKTSQLRWYSSEGHSLQPLPQCCQKPSLSQSAPWEIRNLAEAFMLNGFCLGLGLVWFGFGFEFVCLSVCLSALTCLERGVEPQSASDTVGFQLSSYMWGVEDGTHAKLGTTKLRPQPADAMLFFFKKDFRSVICTSLRVDM